MGDQPVHSKHQIVQSRLLPPEARLVGSLEAGAWTEMSERRLLPG